MFTRSILLLIVLLFLTFNSQAQAKPSPHIVSGNELFFAVSAGKSELLQKSPVVLGAEFKEFFGKLKRGTIFSASTGYYFTRHLGAGIKYHFFASEQNAENLNFQILIFNTQFDVSGKMRIHSITPSFFARLPLLDNKLILSADTGPAWMIYRSNGSIDAESETFNGSLPGVSGGVSAAFMISKFFGLTGNVNYLHAFLPATESGPSVEDQLIALVAENYRKISRLEVSAGLTFRLKP